MIHIMPGSRTARPLMMADRKVGMFLFAKVRHHFVSRLTFYLLMVLEKGQGIRIDGLTKAPSEDQWGKHLLSPQTHPVNDYCS